MNTTAPTAADLRGLIAIRRVRIYQLAGRVHVHPSRLSQYLHEHIPLPAELAQRIAHALDEGK
jgi:plasmid maintenance system antidote protein VapI